MEVRQLEYFVAVAEECHFTRAARRMRVAQSGLSASIRALERELGAPLFVRSTRQVGLTEAGRALLAEARRMLGAIVAAREAVAAVQGLVRGTLAVGTVQCLTAIDLPALLAQFRAAHPGIEVRLRQGGSEELVELVRTGRLDVAFVGRPPRCPEGVEMATLSVEPLMLACGPDHPLAQRAAVSLGDLADEPFVDFLPDWQTRDTVDRALAAAGVDRGVALEVNDVHSLLDLVSYGLGVALVPCGFSRKSTRVRFVPLAGEPPVWEVAMATARESVSAAATVLLGLVESARSVERAPVRAASA